MILVTYKSTDDTFEATYNPHMLLYSESGSKACPKDKASFRRRKSHILSMRDAGRRQMVIERLSGNLSCLTWFEGESNWNTIIRSYNHENKI